MVQLKMDVSPIVYVPGSKVNKKSDHWGTHVKSKDSRSLGPILTFFAEALENHGSLAPKNQPMIT